MTTSPVAILDAHVHFWDPATTPRPGSPFVRLFGWHPPLLRRVVAVAMPSVARAFVGKPEIMFSPYMPPEHRRAFGRHRLRGLVHVQAGWLVPFAMGPVGETRWLERIGGDDLLGIVAHADLTMGRGLERVLLAHKAASARLRGVRHILAHSSAPGVMRWTKNPAYHDDPAFREGYAMLARHGLRFDAWMYHHQLKGFAALARAHPEVPVVLCHAGTPAGLGGPFGGVGRTAGERAHIHAEWREGMAALAALPHVHVKLSGLTMPILGFGFHERETPPSAVQGAEALGPLLREVVDLFGEDRCMFASNFPMDSVSAPLETIVDAYLLAFADRSPGALAKIFAENAARFYDLPGRGIEG